MQINRKMKIKFRKKHKIRKLKQKQTIHNKKIANKLKKIKKI